MYKCYWNRCTFVRYFAISTVMSETVMFHNLKPIKLTFVKGVLVLYFIIYTHSPRKSILVSEFMIE